MPRIKGQRGGGVYGPATIDPKAYAAGQKALRVKKAIAAVYEWIGGTQAFAEWARENPTDFYTKMLIKTMPTQNKVSMDVNVRKSVSQYSDDELQAIVAGECERIAGPKTGEEVSL